MAAVTAAAPPPTSPPPTSSIHHKPIHLSSLSLDSDDSKALPAVPPPSDSPRIRLAPVSPVLVDFHVENWAKPSNANVEISPASTLTAGAADHNLPKTPDAPTPPPHTPHTLQTPSMSAAAAAAAAAETRALPTLNVRPISRDSAGKPAKDNDSSPASTSPRLAQDTTALGSKANVDNRISRETTGTASSSQQPTSMESSAATSTSSISGINEAADEAGLSPESSLEDIPNAQPVPQLHYHHQPFLPHSVSMSAIQQQEPAEDVRFSSNPDLLDRESPVNRHLTPSSNTYRRSSLPRPQSSYSAYSDLGRGRSPGLYGGSRSPHARVPSSNSRNSPDARTSSYADMLNVPYPQPAPAPITLDNAQLRTAVGTNASLLSVQKTLEMYRQNVKKTNDMSIQYSFAVFLISTAQEQGLSFDSPKRKSSSKQARDLDSPDSESSNAAPHELVREARSILQRLSNAGYPFAQYYLADGYASGLFSKGKEDYNAAFPLFVLAAKHGHAESAYRTALCYEFGWGCRKDPTKAVQFLRSAASKHHPGAMTRLGKACLSGDLGEKRYREGIKWMKLASESADAIYNGAPYQLGVLYETGYGDDIFKDESYAAELFTQAAELGHPDANFRMGDAYEHGKLNCPRDPALSVHFYTGAAERGHPAAMMGLCAWYMVGAEPLLEKDEEEAYEWAHRSAELGFVKAQYAVGYFTEMGIGCRRDVLEANVWYVKAADAGDERAKQRLAAIRAAASGGTPMEVDPPRSVGKIRKASGKDENCAVM